MLMNFERRKDTERRNAEYRINIGSYFQDLTQAEVDVLFEKMCNNLQNRCSITNNENSNVKSIGKEERKWEITKVTHESKTFAGTLDVVKCKVRTGYLWMIVTDTECLGKDMKWDSLLNRVNRDYVFYSNFYFDTMESALLVANKYFDSFKQQNLTEGKDMKKVSSQTQYEYTPDDIKALIAKELDVGIDNINVKFRVDHKEDEGDWRGEYAGTYVMTKAIATVENK